MKKTILVLMVMLSALSSFAGLSEAVLYLHPEAIPLIDFAVRDNGDGPFISMWNTNKLGAFPSQQALDDAMAAADVKNRQDAANNKSGQSTELRAVWFQDYWTNTAGWLIEGKPPVPTNGLLRLDPTNVAFNGQSIQLSNYVTMSDSLDVSVTFISRIPVFDYGIFVGFVNSNTFCGGEFSVQCDLAATNSHLTWRQDATGAADGSVTNQSLTGFGTLSGHIGRLTVSKRGKTLHSTYENLTTLQKFSMHRRDENGPVCYAVKIGAFGGVVDIVKVEIIQPQPYNPDLLVIGDSKTAGSESFTDETRWFGGLGFVGTINIFAGGCCRTRELLLSLPEILDQKPKRVLLCIGRNDFASGMSSNTFALNYTNIVTQLRDGGAEVYHIPYIPETAMDQTALAASIRSSYTNLVDISTNWVNAIHLDTVTELNPDIHPSPVGQLYIGSEIRRLGVLPTNDVLKPFRMPPLPATIP